jgi:hypothetical protein
MIPETAASYNPTERGPATESQIKSAWYRQIFAPEILRNMPKLKIVTQFEEIKRDGSGIIRDWRVANNSETLSAFKDIIVSSKVTLATDFTVTCGGQIKVKKN